jgi:DNA-binding NarL/FixJ family response regulator
MSSRGFLPPRNHAPRILLVDAMEVVRAGLAKIIGAASSFIICAETGDYDEVPSLIEEHRPHLVIAEPFQKNRDGIAWIKKIATDFRQTKILVASSNAEATYAERALRAGATGYWMKNGTINELLQAIDTVLSGELYVSPHVAMLAVHKLVDRPANGSGGVGSLSDRELHVFALIGAGHGVGQIADELGISRKTVETHCEHIKLKLSYPDAGALKRGARELLATSS